MFSIEEVVAMNPWMTELPLDKSEELSSRGCPDCGVWLGELHGENCDVARCFTCGMQALGCDCNQILGDRWWGLMMLEEVWMAVFHGKWVYGPPWTSCDWKHDGATSDINAMSVLRQEQGFIMSPLIEEFQELMKAVAETNFPTGPVRWLGTGSSMKVYMRGKAGHVLPPIEEGTRPQLQSCIDIANINFDEDVRRKGLFTHFLLEVHRKNPYDVTYIENVLEPRFGAHLERLGWKPYVIGGTPSYYRYTDRVLFDSRNKAILNAP